MLREEAGWHGDTKDECTEYGVDTDGVGEPGACHEQNQHCAQHRWGDRVTPLGYRPENAQRFAPNCQEQQSI